MPRFQPSKEEISLFDIYAENDVAKAVFIENTNSSKMVNQADGEPSFIPVFLYIREYGIGSTDIELSEAAPAIRTVKEPASRPPPRRLLTFASGHGDVQLGREHHDGDLHCYLFLDPDEGLLFLHVLRGSANVMADNKTQTKYQEEGMPGYQQLVPDTADKIYIDVGNARLVLEWKPLHKPPNLGRSREVRKVIARRTVQTMEMQDDVPEEERVWILGRRVQFGDSEKPAWRILGEGYSGIVYEAGAPGGKVFAAKMIKSEVHAWSIGNEYKWLKKLKHENVIELVGYQGDEHEGGAFRLSLLLFRKYGVLDQLEWGHRHFDSERQNFTKDFELCTSPVMTDRLVDDLARDLWRAFDFLDRQGVVHRDIKADNVLFDPCYYPSSLDGARSDRDPGYLFILTDFGLIRESSDKPPRGHELPEETYRPLETLDDSLDKCSDWWAVGILLATVAGYICLDEVTLSRDGWCIKAQSLGATPPGLEEDLPAALGKPGGSKTDAETDTRRHGLKLWFAYLEWLTKQKDKDDEFILPQAYRDLLVQDPSKRKSPGHCLEEFEKNRFYLLKGEMAHADTES
ncbi:kinase-like domain-containing protein [Lasiosphaeria miniovina]|uniref:Kinase-like domain-containing protein n=1 Tax=Lasiosphaeria miniovina TaxID=1954250 RepID=A0AA39ZQK9_9PEZI|nr:kinase-like domain-containing protein [Lasiosphaeria miniovina]KAK0701831.1 kinase-like domain-containing protein [Lasiosphaeria miniovina]